MGLQSQLREQSRRDLPQIGQPRQTMVLAGWKGDSLAENLCEAIPQAFQPLYKRYLFGTASELTNRLGKMIAAAGDQATPIYLIWVWGERPAPDFRSVIQSFHKPFRSVTVDVCRVNDASGAWPGGYRYGYYLHSDPAQAADELLSLLMLAATGRGTLDLPPAGQNFQLRTTLYNSKERDLVRQLVEQLKGLLEIDQALELERFANAFGPNEEDMAHLYQLLPHPMDLPIPGIKRLATLLAGKERSFIGGTGQHADVTVQDALEAFFGTSDNQALPEYLRSVLQRELPSRCRSYLSGLDLERRCYQQPICILRNWRYLVSRHKESIRGQREENQKKCGNVLRGRFTPLGTGFSALLGAMNDYFKIWKEFMYCELKKAWWEEVDKIFDENSEIMREATAAYHRLSNGLAIATRLNMGPYVADSGGIPIDWRNKTPESILSGLFSQAEFSRDEIVQIIQNAQTQSDRQVPAEGMRETWMLYGGVLDEINDFDDQGRPVFRKKGESLAFRGATGHLRILSFQNAQMGRYVLWEIQITPANEIGR